MNMNFDLNSKLNSEAINRQIIELSPDSELYLVGGYVRDLLLGKVNYDKDYVIIGESAIEFAKKIAEAVNGYYVLLDKDYDIARVVLPDKKYFLDFAGCMGKDIYEDLARRDYTVNSIAYRLDGKESGLIDPFNGIGDLENKIIKAISEKNLVDDPLRLLRAFRFAAQLDFVIDDKTLEYIEKHKSLINKVANERINMELVKLFEANNSAKNLILMKNNGLLFEIIPELIPQQKVPPNLHHHLGLIDHSIESVRQIGLIIPELPDWVKKRLNSEFMMNVKVLSLLKFATLLHDLGKPKTWQIDELGRHRFIKHDEAGAQIATELLRRLKFSKIAIKYITKLIKYHIYPSQLLRSTEPVTEKAVYRMFRKLGDETPDVITLAMADRLSARGPEITEEIVENNTQGLLGFLEEYRKFKEQADSIPKLLSGHEIMKILELPRGPEIGKVVNALREAQISGDINTKDEAIAFIKGFEFKE